MSASPDVSVLLPVQAPAPWLAETLASLEAQTYPNWDLVAVVDGPDEEIETLLADFGGKCVVIQRVEDCHMP